MNRIHISIETDGLNEEQAQALANLGKAFRKATDAVNDFNEVAAKAETSADQAEPEKKKRNRTPNKPDATIVPERDTFDDTSAKEAEVTEPEIVEPEDDLMGDEPQADAPTVTREQIRSKVSDKQAVHKEAIRAKLKELNAENVTKLEDKHFGSFYAFLQGLK